MMYDSTMSAPIDVSCKSRLNEICPKYKTVPSVTYEYKFSGYIITQIPRTIFHKSEVEVPSKQFVDHRQSSPSGKNHIYDFE